ncbi:MAG: transporter substrate-binding domain-containing protein [Desulfobacterales bacterium]|nr:transporter substrate-binding domain-containing protein [Desulfobacterales bacterium]
MTRITAGALSLAVLLLCLFLVPCSAAQREETGPHRETVRGFSYDYTDEEIAFIQANPEIKVSNEFDWPPFDFVADGKPAGFGIELMDLLAEKSGLTFTYINGYTWDELTRMFFEGGLDVLHSLSITPERQKKAFFSAPYYHSKHVLVYRSDTLDLHTLDDLDGKIIAMPRGWSTIEFFETHYPEVHIIEVESSRQALEYVDQGKVAATVEQEGIAQYLITKFGFTDLALSKWLDNEELQKTSSMHFAVLKTNPVLFSILDKALSNITLSEMRDLKEKWFSRAGRRIGADDVGLTPEEREWLTEKKLLTYCAPLERMPYSALNGVQPTGISADLMEIFSEHLGVKMVPVPAASFSDSIALVENGTCDLIPMISKTRERQRYLDFTTAHSGYNVALIAREDTPFLQGISGLTGLRTGIVPHTNVFEKVITQYPKLNYRTVDTIEDCLKQVSTGRLDVAILSLPVASHYIRKKGMTNLKVAGHTNIEEDLRLAVLKGNTTLHSILSKAVRSISLQEMEAIENKWVTLQEEQPVNYTLIWQILGGSVAVLVLVMLWNRKLARLNRAIARANRKLQDKTKELEYISITDSLTSLYNRRYVEKAFELELRRTVRHKHALAVLLIDIDFFKAINDTFGHQVGDGVLRTFANLLKTNIRATDVLGRWGGEEFIIVCPEINIDNAVHMARGLCRKVEQTPFDIAGTQTASFGVTAYKKGDDIHSMISRADNALYQAKTKGRNRVESVA